jgi:hypothetical protein
MATVTAVVQNVQIERGDDDARAAAIGNLKRATVYFDNGGVVVTGPTDGDVLSINLATAIQNKVRNGKTVTIRTASISQALTTQLLAAPFTEVTHAGFITAAISAGATITIAPKSNGYLTGSADSTIASSATVTNVRPYAVVCAYTEA